MPVPVKYLRNSPKINQIENDVTNAAHEVVNSRRLSRTNTPMLWVDDQMYYSENGLPGRRLAFAQRATQAYIERVERNLFRGFVQAGSVSAEFEGTRSEVIAELIERISKLGF
jgi:hypothetical protein